MSVFGAALTRALAPLGGPGVAGAMVAGGLALGALGGGLAVTMGGGGGNASAGAGGTLPVYGCPGTGSPLAEVKAGQSVLATGRTEDGTWLRIHLPLPGRTEGWVQASPLKAKSAIEALPVATCQPELAILPPPSGPTATLTVPGSFAPPSGDIPPTPTPTATATATPTATPVANARPRLGNLTASPRSISYDPGGWCPTDPTRATFRVRAIDDTGIASVQLFWRAPGASTFTATSMTAIAGNRRAGTWQASLNTTANGLKTAGRLAYYVVATDVAGATRRLPVDTTAGVTVKVCQNTGPTITQAKSSSGSSLYWDELGVGSCQTATNLTAVVKDVDGVKSVTLFYRKPGSRTYSSKPMDNSTLPGRWYANLDTLGDKISIASPPTDGMAWYIRAVDDLGKASQTSARTITIRRCDTAAEMSSVAISYSCSVGSFSMVDRLISDRDQPENGLSVTFYWKLTPPAGVAGKALSGKSKATVTKGTYYAADKSGLNLGTYYGWTISVYAISTDKYGGTTRSGTTSVGWFCIG